MRENPVNRGRPTARTRMLLSCSECNVEVTVLVHADPRQGEGWPRHRCGHDVRPFDIGEAS